MNWYKDSKRYKFGRCLGRISSTCLPCWWSVLAHSCFSFSPSCLSLSHSQSISPLSIELWKDCDACPTLYRHMSRAQRRVTAIMIDNARLRARCNRKHVSAWKLQSCEKSVRAWLREFCWGLPEHFFLGIVGRHRATNIAELSLR